VADLESGSTILSAGFGLCGTAGQKEYPSLLLFSLYQIITCCISDTIIGAIERRSDGLKNLTVVSNNAGAAGRGGLSPLLASKQISRMILSYLGSNKLLEMQYLTGKVAIELCPQGSIAERIRAGGAGIPAFFTPTGVSM
jgi:3-oxoacid CoA-transferase